LDAAQGQAQQGATNVCSLQQVSGVSRRSLLC
jgi:hypothetical protein